MSLSITRTLVRCSRLYARSLHLPRKNLTGQIPGLVLPRIAQVNQQLLRRVHSQDEYARSQPRRFLPRVLVGLLGAGALVGVTAYITKEMMAREAFPPNYAKRPPHHLVLRGGGLKGIAFPAALKELERQGALKEVRSVAGTSAGAITATLLAVGWTPDELSKISEEAPLESFLDYGNIGGVAGHVVDTACDGVTAAVAYAQSLPILNIVMGGSPFGAFTASVIARYKAATFLDKLQSLPALCTGEPFRLWLEQRIRDKTGIEHCTYGELAELAKREPHKYRELYVYVARLNAEGPATVLCLGTTDLDPQIACKDIIISDGARCSMSIPVIFEPHHLHIKKDGKRVPLLGQGRFVDGGILANFPIETFDDKAQGKANPRTLGLGFEATRNEPPPTGRKLKVQELASAYLNFEESLTETRPYNSQRMILLPTQGLGTLPRALTTEERLRVAEGAREKIRQTFDRYRSQ